MTLNMQSLGLMYNKFDIVNNPQSDHYGYPNLGRPNDHFEVTPFEAIYVDNNIDPHINLKDRNQVDLTELNNFIYNELEPWYLYLQNDTVGAQARPNYIYKSRRMARNGIIIGDSVTPSTDFGHFAINPNAELILQAGEFIDLGVSTFPEGSQLTATIDYPSCGGISGRAQHEEDNTQNNSSTVENSNRLNENNVDLYALQIFPNPTNENFTLQCDKGNTIESFSIYNFSGNLVLEEKNINIQQKEVEVRLDKGTYIVVVTINGEIIHKKLMVL